MPSMHLAQVSKWVTQSPPVEWGIKQLRQLLIGALRQGPIPEHVAFVMDGNRRFARNHRIETVEGHNLGFEALARVSIMLSILSSRILADFEWIRFSRSVTNRGSRSSQFMLSALKISSGPNTKSMRSWRWRRLNSINCHNMGHYSTAMVPALGFSASAS